MLHNRIIYLALPCAVALTALGAAAWAHGGKILTRGEFVWRGIHFTADRVRPFAFGYRAAGFAFFVMSAWLVAIWFREVLNI